jgi:hypothetical protein
MLALSKSSKRTSVSLLLPEERNRSSLRNVISQLLAIPNDGQSPDTLQFCGETVGGEFFLLPLTES